jgi:P pilus assembly chaperone PapD
MKEVRESVEGQKISISNPEPISVQIVGVDVEEKEVKE